MKVTIKDVAREAGVSVATVSRVLNDSGPVSERARRRIRETAARLRYVPDGAARSLSMRKTNTLGVLLPELYGEFFSEVIRGIDHTARRHHHHLLVSSSHSDRCEIEAALAAMRGRVDGLILMSPDMDAHTLVAPLPESFPVVLLNCATEGGAADAPTVDALTVDNYGGAYAMVRHLAGDGRRVAIITGGDENHDARERLRGFRDALRDAGAEHRAAWEIPGDFREAAGFAAAARVLALRPRPTAIFAANDAMAIGAISALREAGVRVPEDIAVGGFDDIPMAAYVSPPLSSVHVPITELGARAVERLLHALEHGNTHVRRRETLPARLVVRHSSGGGRSEGSERSALAPSAERVEPLVRSPPTRRRHGMGHG